MGQNRFTKKDIKQEEEANYFASCLLMPQDMFLGEYEKVRGFQEEERTKLLSKIFDVPEWAVMMRINQLKEIILTQ